MRCKVCDSPATPLFSATVLNKHEVAYFRCPSCGFVQTEEPYWLAEAYSSAISELDLGPVNRAVTGSALVEGMILAFFDPNATFIDWGGGYGLLTRLMRDRGYDFRWSDLYCENLFARQFVANDDTSYELLTAFEVFEHLVDPITEIAKMTACSDNLLFSTVLAPPSAPALKDWWYRTPETGQHVSFYTPKALAVISERFGLHLSSDGTDTHLLSKRPVSRRLFRVMARNGRAAQGVRRVLRRKLRRHSLLMDDFRAVTGWNV